MKRTDSVTDHGDVQSKVIVRNGDAPSKTIYKLRGVALRIPRDPSSDRMAIKLRVNLSTEEGTTQC